MKRLRLPFSRPAAPVLIGIILTVSAAALSAGETNAADSVRHRFQVGYEHGISCRYFPVPNWGIGLIVSSSRLYRNEKEKQESTYETDTYLVTSRRDYHYKNKNFDIVLEGLRGINLKKPFTLHLFASAGGSYSNDTRRYSYEDTRITIDHTSDGGGVETPGTSTEEQIINPTEIGGFGQFGIMPGIQWGRFNVALRLGVEGRYTKSSSPEDATEKRSGHSTSVTFIYPYSLIESLILHFDL